MPLAVDPKSSQIAPLAVTGGDLAHGPRSGRLENGPAVLIQISQGQGGGGRRCQFPLLGGQEDAGRATDEVHAAGSDHRFVEVVDVVTEVSFGRSVGAEVLQVQVTADQDVPAQAPVGTTRTSPGRTSESHRERT